MGEYTVILLLLGCALAYRSLQAASTERLNANVFMQYLRKLILDNNISRALKLCSASNTPFTKAVKAVLIQSTRLSAESAEKIHACCEEVFAAHADIIRAKRAIGSLDQITFIVVIGLSLLLWGIPEERWMLAMLGLSALAMMYEQQVKTTTLSDLQQQARPLAEAIIALHQPAETPYR